VVDTETTELALTTSEKFKTRVLELQDADGFPLPLDTAIAPSLAKKPGSDTEIESPAKISWSYEKLSVMSDEFPAVSLVYSIRAPTANVPKAFTESKVKATCGTSVDPT
jgi:hypothetical protein